jgi:RNase P subunit RPR2
MPRPQYMRVTCQNCGKALKLSKLSVKRTKADKEKILCITCRKKINKWLQDV